MRKGISEPWVGKGRSGRSTLPLCPLRCSKQSYVRGRCLQRESWLWSFLQEREMKFLIFPKPLRGWLSDLSETCSVGSGVVLLCFQFARTPKGEMSVWARLWLECVLPVTPPVGATFLPGNKRISSSTIALSSGKWGSSQGGSKKLTLFQVEQFSSSPLLLKPLGLRLLLFPNWPWL